MATRTPNGRTPDHINLMFRAFSDRTRLRILRLLQDGAMCVGDLLAVLRVPQPTASRHLAYLRKAGLVTTRREGTWVYYALSPAKSRFHRQLLRCIQGCLGEVPDLDRDARQARQLRKAGGCCR
jgi:ArsR family transcriptional regulator, arsenate/arsenite/antimonite-responsive transcriptional repressor